MRVNKMLFCIGFPVAVLFYAQVSAQIISFALGLRGLEYLIYGITQLIASANNDWFDPINAAWKRPDGSTYPSI